MCKISALHNYYLPLITGFCKVINKSIDTFCYPYGGKISYNDYTLKILKKLKYKLAYSVEYRDISFRDIRQKPYELPRYDCNLF